VSQFLFLNSIDLSAWAETALFGESGIMASRIISQFALKQRKELPSPKPIARPARRN
jgi:hypothetical protein